MKVLMCILLALCLLLPGCQLEQMKQDVEKAKTQIQAYQLQMGQVKQERDKLKFAISKMPEGEERNKAIKYVAVLDEWLLKADLALAKLKGLVTELEAELETATTDADATEAAARGAAGILPQPWQAFALFGIGLAGGLFRAAHNRRAGRNVAASVNEHVKALDASEKAGLGVLQTNSAKRLVDEAQGTKFRWPI